MFDYDSLVVTVATVNPRSETHGEEDVPAVDVILELSRTQNDAIWEEILAELSYESDRQEEVNLPPEADILDAKGMAWGKVTYNRQYTEYKANFRVGTKKIASLVHAKINKFVWVFDEEHGQVLRFRIQAAAKGDQQGPLTELIKHRVRLETAAMQDELPLGNEHEEEAPA